jgi:hypothetical protein
LFALAAVEGTPDLKQVLLAMKKDFSYPIDLACSDVSRLRFLSYDPNIIVKKQVAVANLTEAEDISDEPIRYVPFPIDLLPPVLRNMVIGVQKTIGLKDCSTPAVTALAVVSSIIGASCKIKRKADYMQPAHIYTAIIQRSGGAKSPAIEIFLEPLQKKQNENIAKWKRRVSKYESYLQKWKELPKIKQGNCPLAPKPPKRFYVGDITIEALGQKLEENPQGLLLYSDELDSFFGGMQRYNNGRDLPHYIEIHNGKPLTIDRKTSGLISIPNPSLSIISGIQPAILQQQLKENPAVVGII